jgi:thymidylate synthase
MFTIIAALDINRGISLDGRVPWYCPHDMKFFKELTHNHVVIMGRKTYESIPRGNSPMPDRINIVLSQSEFKDDGVLVMTMDQCVQYCTTSIQEFKNKRMFVIGGASIYQQFMDKKLVRNMVISHVIQDFECDQYFPSVRKKEWTMTSSQMLDGNPLVKVCGYSAINADEKKFIDAIAKIASEGIVRPDRTGVGTVSVFSGHLRFSLRDGQFPLMTHRNINLRMIFEELMWILRGQTDSKILASKKVPIWNANTTREFLDARGLTHLKEGDIGAAYGFQLRYFGAKYTGCSSDYTGQGFDQLQYVIDTLKNNPSSRRIMFSMWNPVDLEGMALPPCAWSAQFYVADGVLSCKLVQRSSDIALAGGWNIAQYALLTYLLANICSLKPGDLIWTPGDTHIYLNQMAAANEITNRVPRPFPAIYVASPADGQITGFEWDDITLKDYDPVMPQIKIPMNA